MKEITIKNLNYSYTRKKNVLKAINLTLRKGELAVLAGPNGCGKTTMIKLIFDLLGIQEGKIKIDEIDHSDAGCKRNMMYLPGDNNIPEFLTGYEYVKLMCKLYEFKGDTEILKRLSDYYSMSEYMGELIESYSHGMKKKIQLICAFYIKPEFIVIDETLNGIDIKAKEVSKELIKKLAKKRTVLLCTHDLEFAQEIGERAILMYEGHIYQDIHLEEIRGETTLLNLFKEIINFEELAYEI